MKFQMSAPMMLLAAAAALVGCGPDSNPGQSPSESPGTAAAVESTDGAPGGTGTQGADADPHTASSFTVVVNKHNPLDPEDYVPANLADIEGHQLRQEAADALRTMLSDMRAEGVNVNITSAYRSYDTQVSTYDHWVQQNGQAAADRVSARPGFSEHQTGLAVDLADGSGCDLQVCFEQTPAAEWAMENAAEYGFVLRFPDGMESVTGYSYEPWHFRYVGADQAQGIQASRFSTLEEYYGTGAAPDYR
ncbi:M15 family metallopeptidase [Kocuria sp.]|uniref:M15 family metallopeptidase n=1 Tax=Kocuria sp. TaxID=1871328 RepID=UPI0026DF33B8|nr:M15 family metallopeptidase [Kocuria sp.]MDO5617357.1 M15 family metallopeptidase [Kocuria sp.]